MAHPQQERFETRFADLREFRKAEREAVREMERAADGTHEEFLIAEANHRMWLDVVKTAAAELAVVYFED
jgi:hypothetical protein